MNNQRAIDRLTKHLEWGWSKKTVDAIEMGIHALKETQWIPCSTVVPETGMLQHIGIFGKAEGEKEQD